MTGATRRRLCICPIDRFGREIDPALLSAAEKVYGNAFSQGLPLLEDPAVVQNVFEEAMASVSRRLSSGQQIKNLPRYLMMTFLRKANRIKRKQIKSVTVDETEWSEIAWVDPTTRLEMTILLDQLLARCDRITHMGSLRNRLLPWDEIGKMYGISAHAAEARCLRVFKRLRKELKLGKLTFRGCIEKCIYTRKPVAPRQS